VQIKPGIPDKNSGKIYKLQVGAFSSIDTATAVYQQVRAAGFDGVLEQAGTWYRVLATGISAANVYAAAQRLGAVGFKEVLVRE
jgi:cell division protein FtsN